MPYKDISLEAVAARTQAKGIPRSPMHMEVYSQHSQDQEFNVSHICTDKPMDTEWIGRLVTERVEETYLADCSSDGQRMTLYSRPAWEDIAPKVGEVIGQFLWRTVEFTEHEI